MSWCHGSNSSQVAGLWPQFFSILVGTISISQVLIVGICPFWLVIVQCGIFHPFFFTFGSYIAWSSALGKWLPVWKMHLKAEGRKWHLHAPPADFFLVVLLSRIFMGVLPQLPMKEITTNQNVMGLVYLGRGSQIGSTPIAGWSIAKIPNLKWMMNRGTPILRYLIV